MNGLVLGPEQYTQVSTYDLLCAAEQGFAGLDHRLLHAIVDDPEKAIPDLLRFGLEERDGRRFDVSEDLIQIFRHLRTPRAIPYLIEYLRRNHLDTTIPLICAFQEIGEPAVPPLLAFYEEVKAEEDSDAAFLLGSLGVRDPRVLQVLVERLKIDPVDAGHCLAAYGDPAAIPAIREAIEQSGHKWIAESLRSSAEALESAPAFLDDEPFDLFELYPEETDPSFEVLTEEETELFLDSSDADNRFAAVMVLSEGKTAGRLWDRFLKMAREDPDTRVRGLCWEALLDGWDRPDIRQAMRDCVADEKAPNEERCGALQSLAAREGASAGIGRWILHFYEQPSTRAKALEAMAISFNPRFEKYFSKHLGDPDSGVCIQAMLGIGLLEVQSEAPRLVPFFKDDELREHAMAAYAMCASCEPSRAGLRRLFQKIDTLAGGASPDEGATVKDALNTRADRYGLEPVFGPDGEALIDEPLAVQAKTGRNDPCPCGSGKKYKKCCGG